MDAAPTHNEWLSWDGKRLRWRLVGDLGGVAATQLQLDGIAFENYPAASVGAHEIECEFPFSPSGHDVLSFRLVSADDANLTVLAMWHVQHDVAATWTSQDNAPAISPQGLAPLADTPSLPKRTLSALPPVAIVVPIYNSPQCVQSCIESVRHWSSRATLILIDDASSDPRIGELLAAYIGQAQVRIHRNERNRGYTHSVNVGMQLAGGADVVLLNSDTVVGPRWLATLKIAAYAADDIGTVTAVSDNAGAFSVPELERHCPIPPRWNLVQTQRALLQYAGLRYPQLPTGNGFCMYVKRNVIARIGPMDEGAFPQGYGEENDFCQRAARAGFRHIIAGNVFVHHERSASFGDERRAALGAQGMTVLRERYPDYEHEVGATLYSFERRVLDYRVRRLYADHDGEYAMHTPRPRLLVAADAGDDGAERLLDSLQARQQGFLLRREGDWINLYRRVAGELRLERGIAIGNSATALAQIETHLREWLVLYAIESVHARGSAASDGWLAGLAAEFDIPTM